MAAEDLEEWRFNRTLSGTPQGGVVSPILSNIYLDRLDNFVEKTLLPTYNSKAERRHNREYASIQSRAWKLAKAGKGEEARKLRERMYRIPSQDPHDPDYRRLRYVRYADDFLLGFCGPRREAEEVKRQLKEFLRDHLRLELSEEKTLITHARSQAARFLGYDVVVLHDDRKRDRKSSKRSINGNIGLKVPKEVVKAKCAFYMKRGKPVHLTERTNDSVFGIVAQYQQEFRGLVEYYRLAYNLSNRLERLRWVMEVSLTKTLAHKLRISVTQVYRRYQTTIHTERGPYKVLRVVVERGQKRLLVAQWGGISLTWDKDAVLNERPYRVRNDSGVELLQRLLADQCELCGSCERIQVHHVRGLKDLRRKGRAERPEWVRVMAARQRKTLVVCERCHKDIHAGKPLSNNRACEIGHRRAG
jgi:Reverse transcriptase (RNA-dependent DNA polymerase)/Type II intron maturase